MRKLLLVLFCVPLFVVGQDTIGTTYSMGGGYSTFGITFNENDSFKYYSGTCTKSSVAVGTYKIENKKLYLEFSKSELDVVEESHFVIIDSSLCATNVPYIKVKVLADDSIQAYATIVIDNVDGTTTDFDGYGVLRHQSEEEMFIYVYFSVYKTIRRKLSPHYNYHLVAKLYDTIPYDPSVGLVISSHRQPITNATYVYDIQSKNKKLLRIKRHNTSMEYIDLWKDGEVPKLAQDLENLKSFIRKTFNIY
jgi:hypothetical protein